MPSTPKDRNRCGKYAIQVPEIGRCTFAIKQSGFSEAFELWHNEELLFTFNPAETDYENTIETKTGFAFHVRKPPYDTYVTFDYGEMEKIQEPEKQKKDPDATIQETVLGILDETTFTHPWIRFRPSGNDLITEIWAKTVDRVYYRYDFCPQDMDTETLLTILGKAMDIIPIDGCYHILDWNRDSDTYGLAVPASQIIARASLNHGCLHTASTKVFRMRANKQQEMDRRMDALWESSLKNINEIQPKRYVPLKTRVLDTKTDTLSTYAELLGQGAVFTHKIPVEPKCMSTHLRCVLENHFAEHPGLPGQILECILEECKQNTGDRLREHLLDSILETILYSTLTSSHH